MSSCPHLLISAILLASSISAFTEDSSFTVKAPSTIDVLAVDGESRLLNSLLSTTGGERTLTLSPGHHAIKVRYSVYRDIGQDDWEVFRSHPVELEVIGNPDSVWEVVHEPINVETIGDRYDRTVEIDLRLLQEGTPLAESDPRKRPPPEEEDVRTVYVEATESVPAEKTTPVPPREESKTERSKPSSATSSESSFKPRPVAALPMLEYWWSRASKAEQDAFRKQISE